MIRPEKHANALRALNMVLVWTRKMAYDKADHTEIARVLDIAEELPMLFLRDEDMTDYFRGVLEEFSKQYNGFAWALQRFDAE